jgi:hypothetical protein
MTNSAPVKQESIHPEVVQIVKRQTGSFTVRERLPRILRIGRADPWSSVKIRGRGCGYYCVFYFFNVRMYFTTSLI